MLKMQNQIIAMLMDLNLAIFCKMHKKIIIRHTIE